MEKVSSWLEDSASLSNIITPPGSVTSVFTVSRGVENLKPHQNEYTPAKADYWWYLFLTMGRKRKRPANSRISQLSYHSLMLWATCVEIEYKLYGSQLLRLHNNNQEPIRRNEFTKVITRPPTWRPQRPLPTITPNGENRALGIYPERHAGNRIKFHLACSIPTVSLHLAVYNQSTK